MRKKPQPIIDAVRTLTDANGALARIGEYRRQITLIETRMNEVIDQAKAAFAATAEPLQAQIALIEAGLAAFAELNKKELCRDKRTVELDYGRIGFRKSSQIKPKLKHTWQMVLDLIKQMKFSEAVRVKEEVNKEEMAAWPDERLALVGARRVEKDQFWYEVDQDSISDKTAAA